MRRALRFSQRLLFTLLPVLGVIAACGASDAQEGSGPLFSTPASRSSTPVPILTDPSAPKSPDLLVPGTAGKSSPPKERTATEKQNSAAESVPPSAGKSFGTWTLQCVGKNSGGAKMECQITASSLSPDGSQVIAVMSLVAVSEDAPAKFQLAVPLGVALEPGITMMVGKHAIETYKIARCTTQGCLVEAEISPGSLNSMKTAKALMLKVKTPNGDTIDIPLSLTGFSEALDALVAINGKAKVPSKS